MVRHKAPDEVARLLDILRETMESGETLGPRGPRARLRRRSVPQRPAKIRGVLQIATHETKAAEASLRVLTKLLPTLQSLLHRLAGQREAAIETVALRVFCDWMRVPVYLVDGGLRVRFANRAAIAVGADHGVRVSDGRLKLRDKRVTTRLAEFVSNTAAVNTTEDSAHDFGLLPGGRSLHVRAATPLPAAAGEHLWFVSLEEGASDPLARWRASGLTEAEARIAALIASGKRPRQVATDVGIAINTVCSHLKAIFAKLDVHTQSGLVRIALEGAQRERGRG